MNRVVYCFAALSALTLTVGCKSTCCGYDPDCPLCVSETSGCGDGACGASGSCGAGGNCGPGACGAGACGAGNGISCAAPGAVGGNCGCSGGFGTNCAGAPGCSGCAGGFGGSVPTCTACGQPAPMYDGPMFEGDVIPGTVPAPAPPSEQTDPAEDETTTMIIPTVPLRAEPQQTHWIPRASK